MYFCGRRSVAVHIIVGVVKEKAVGCHTSIIYWNTSILSSQCGPSRPITIKRIPILSWTSPTLPSLCHRRLPLPLPRLQRPTPLHTRRKLFPMTPPILSPVSLHPYLLFPPLSPHPSNITTYLSKHTLQPLRQPLIPRPNFLTRRTLDAPRCPSLLGASAVNDDKWERNVEADDGGEGEEGE